MKMLRWLVVLGVALALIGCGEGSDAETAPEQKDAKPAEKLREASMTLEGLFSAENVGLAMAKRQGYFEEMGLDLLIMSPSPPKRPTKYVSEGSSDIGVSHAPQVVLAQRKGAPIVVIGSLVPEPTMAMIWLKQSGIESIADLKGKTIATPGVPFQEAILEAVLKRAGLTLDDVELKEVEYKLLPALISGRADAIFGASGNVEGIELEARGLDPVVTPVSKLGIPAYDELVVIARRDRVAKSPEFFREFMAAVRRGTAAAAEDPDTATEAILTGLEDELYPANRKATEASLEATLPLLSRSGEVDRKRASEFAAWMRSEGLTQP